MTSIFFYKKEGINKNDLNKEIDEVKNNGKVSINKKISRKALGYSCDGEKVFKFIT
ncbi:MAG TPA: hypothetical protein VNS08_03770 [Ureibacillus sp.]|nr:hypothetical protein [Ureibacillus sp.]